MGSGFRTFTAGEVLTASNVQNYLMDQSVMVFGGSAARSSAIGTANFEEGMVSYLTDTDKVEAYNGTDWVSVAPTTSQGLTLINTTSFSGVSSQAINSCFSATYTNYRLVISGNMAGTVLLNFRFRTGVTDDTGSNYSWAEFVSDGSGSYAASQTGQNIGRLAGFVAVRSAASVDIFSPFETKTTGLTTVGVRSFSNPNQYNMYNGVNTSTSYDGINLIAASGNMTGEVSVYGYSK